MSVCTGHTVCASEKEGFIHEGIEAGGEGTQENVKKKKMLH